MTDLFEYAAHARRTDPKTSLAAAHAVSDHLPHLEAEVMRSAHRAGPAGRTVDEFVADLGIDKVTISPRLRPLCEKQLLEEHGTRKALKSNRRQIVWRERATS